MDREKEERRKRNESGEGQSVEGRWGNVTVNFGTISQKFGIIREGTLERGYEWKKTRTRSTNFSADYRSRIEIFPEQRMKFDG